MNNVTFVARDGFNHGGYNFDRPGDVAIMPKHTADSLVAAGLGTIRPPVMSNKMLLDSTQGNAVGPGAPSSASPAGQASPSTTLNPSGSGKLSLPKRTG